MERRIVSSLQPFSTQRSTHWRLECAVEMRQVWVLVSQLQDAPFQQRTVDVIVLQDDVLLESFDGVELLFFCAF